MTMQLVELLLSKPTISDWSASEMAILQQFSPSELEVILKTLSTNNISFLASSSWQ